MSTVLFTMEEPTYLPRYIDSILSESADSIDYVVVAPRAEGSLRNTVEERYLMFGPLTFFRYGIQFVFGKVAAALPDALRRRPHSVGQVAEDHDAPVVYQSDINKPSLVEFVESLDLELLRSLSVSCGQKFGEDPLSVLEEEAVNVHGSLLPSYRVRATAFWVLYHDENESGVTAHRMTESFDDGAVFEQPSFEIDDDTMHDVYWKITEVGATVANTVIEDVEADDLSVEFVLEERGEYYSLPARLIAVSFAGEETSSSESRFDGRPSLLCPSGGHALSTIAVSVLPPIRSGNTSSAIRQRENNGSEMSSVQSPLYRDATTVNPYRFNSCSSVVSSSQHVCSVLITSMPSPRSIVQ